MHFARAHTPGTGKSHLVNLAATIATGRSCPVIAAGRTEEETEKRLGALLLAGVSIVSLDNVSADLGGDLLCQMTEQHSFASAFLAVRKRRNSSARRRSSPRATTSPWSAT